MKQYFYLMAAVLFIGTACSEKHLITDPEYRVQVEKDFVAKQSLFSGKELFSVFEKELMVEEKEALMFLYAYMPVVDITNYDGDYFLRNVRSSLKAKEEMSWGQTIPETVFRHFVLPIRVNNEDLDDARMVFYEELKDRVKGLSLYDAVLEVNHWCHEKVVYTPTDGRTIAPLACVKTAQGRCGEESTFTVTALRAVGIPARQIYTPRWAHTDSNHAWVEAWVNGQWYFFGACEPEPVLNLGWFNGPAYRAMLLHTRVFGKYGGPEEIMTTTANFTEINVLENYAPTAKGIVTVVNSDGKPLENVDVEFKIYNSADFFTVATRQTDSEGKCSLTAGKGDMFIWASEGGKIGYGKLSFGKDDLTIVLDKTPGETVAFDMDIVPPADGVIPAEVTDEQKEENVRRMAEEDEIRKAYVSTFYTEEKAQTLAKKLDLDEQRVTNYMLASRGNWETIERFLLEADPEKRDLALTLLGVISVKDLQDIQGSVLVAHLNETTGDCESPYFAEYVLNPRVSTEFLTTYKEQLRNGLSADFLQLAAQNPVKIIEWCNNELKLINEQNPQRIMARPVGILNARVCDTDARDIFFVSLCRSIGIPARIEPATRKVQYYVEDKWNDVNFAGKEQENAKQGSVMATYQPTKRLPDPAYGNHYSISRIVDGKLQSQYYRGAQGRWSRLLKEPKLMDTGNYMLTTGTRMANGSILIHIDFFQIEENATAETGLVMRESKDDIQVIGNIDAEALYLPVGEEVQKSILATTGRGYFIIGILGARQEPTNHALKDIALVASDFEKWDRKMILLFPNEQNLKIFDKNEFKGLPGTIVYGLDAGSAVSDMIVKAMNLSDASSLPIFIIADTFGRVVFVSQGYTIGLGEQMMNVIHKL
ncbi:MAG: transglutaminase domain-containing protein [Tannerella sp.]|jgi:transglutaminase-like putative cysteine protease|nr:transglutaminase domain-containing protein [Tannerella sp.]